MKTSLPLATAANISKLCSLVSNTPARSAWDKGVKRYALDLLSNFDELRQYNAENGFSVPVLNQKTALNGAANWEQFSNGGCSLVYSFDIAQRLCTVSELKRFDGLPLS